MIGNGYYGYRPVAWRDWHSDKFFTDYLILEE